MAITYIRLYVMDEMLECVWEEDNEEDRYAVAVTQWLAIYHEEYLLCAQRSQGRVALLPVLLQDFIATAGTSCKEGWRYHAS